MSDVVTRFAPSPTGFLHIGGARTALFNWLFARKNGGKCLLRIEDTDRERSTPEAVDALIAGLGWLGLDFDGPAVSQFARKDRHAEMVQKLLDEGKAYHCYCTADELGEMREKARAEGRPPRYDGTWRDRDAGDAPEGVAPAIRLKSPIEGETVLKDAVQGEITVQNREMDDMIILRSDGTPTYLLAVVVDDIDMGITHVIRGDDHLTNTFRQIQIYNALGADLPVFAHIPLIHGADGKKLSKRHGAVGAEAYRDMGYLPVAMRNYLLRLGFGHGDEEIIDDARALEIFELSGIGKSAARFDFAKLEALNGHYIREMDDEALYEAALPFITDRLGTPPDEAGKARILAAMAGLKERAKLLTDLAEASLFLVRARPLPMDEQAMNLLSGEARARLADLKGMIADHEPFTGEALEAAFRAHADEKGIKLKDIAMPFRAALVGAKTSPPIFEMAEILGRDEVIARLEDVT